MKIISTVLFDHTAQKVLFFISIFVLFSNANVHLLEKQNALVLFSDQNEASIHQLT